MRDENSPNEWKRECIIRILIAIAVTAVAILIAQLITWYD